MKKILIIILFIMSLFIFTGCTSEDAKKFKTEYESLNGTTREKDGKTIRTITINKNNPIVYSSAKEINKKIDNKETFVVYFGFSDCPWCRSVVPTLIEAANDLNIKTIYYVDVKDIRDVLAIGDTGRVEQRNKGDEYYYKLLEKFDNLLEDYIIYDYDNNEVNTNEKRIMAPTVISVVKGKGTELTTGISEKQKDGYQKLTESMKKETYKKFNKVLKNVK